MFFNDGQALCYALHLQIYANFKYLKPFHILMSIHKHPRIIRNLTNICWRFLNLDVQSYDNLTIVMAMMRFYFQI